MKKIIFPFTALLIILISCNESNRNIQNESSENDIDAARNFVQAALEGKYDFAEALLLKDSINIEHFNTQKRFYKERMSEQDKEGYRQASIIIYETRRISDSASVLIYANSYKNKKDSLKMVKKNGKWLVDFKYIFKKPETTNLN